MARRTSNQPVKAAGTYRIDGVLPVDRLGYGSMPLAGPGVWDMPDDQRRRSGYSGGPSSWGDIHRHR